MSREAEQTLALFKPGVTLTAGEAAELLQVRTPTVFIRLKRLAVSGALAKRYVAKRGNVYALAGDPALDEVQRGGWWTNERCAQAQALRRSGLTISQITARMGAPSDLSVRARLGRMKVKLSEGRATEWTAELLDQIRTLNGQGKSDGEIGQILGVTRDSVRGKRQRLGLPGITVTAAPRPPRLKVVRSTIRPAKPAKSAPGLRLGPGFSDTPKPPLPPSDEAFMPLEGSTPRNWETRRFGECCWPIETAEGTHSCCLPSASSPKNRSDYCLTHWSLSRAPSQPKKLRESMNPDRVRRAA